VSILLNSVLLATNANGALLLTWLLDTSNLPGRYRLLATRLSPHLAQLCPHKVASVTVLKVINQRVDPASSQILVDAILKSNETQILEDILSEQVHGSSFVGLKYLVELRSS
jgi:protein JSN1